MDIDSLQARIGDSDIRFPVSTGDIAETRPPEAVDALFHLPLLALAILTAARRKSFATTALGGTVARLLVERFTALRDTPTLLERSVTMRRRAVEALVFLEMAGLVDVSDDERREVSISQDGKTLLDRVRRGQDERAFFLKQLRSAQDRAMARLGGL